MKVLTKLLLVHWHYFNSEIIEFGELNFLTGKNASGKSTIIDAMQLILLGDTSGGFFNKAASGRGNRTLKGYLLGELGDDEDSGYRYLRNCRFTSYIAMEFQDKEKNKYFTAGCCFDIYSENDIPRLFFIYDGKIPPQEFRNGKTPMDITALRSFLKENYSGHCEMTAIGKDFKTKLYGKLGGLRDRFAGLLKKAVSFNPNVDIHQFISDFLSDAQKPVDVSHMQENIQSYKRLEDEASVLQERIDLLERVGKTYENYTNAKSSEMLYSFLIERAAADMKNGELHAAATEVTRLTEQLAALQAKIANTESQLAELRNQRDTLNAELKSNGATQALEQIDRQIAEKEQKLLTLRNEYEKAAGSLAVKTAAWRSGTETMRQKIQTVKYDLLQAGLAGRVSDIDAEGGYCLEKISALTNLNVEGITKTGAAGLSEASRVVNNLRTHAIEINTRLQDEQNILSNKRAELLNEQKSLESGVYRFPQDALDLKAAVSSRLRTVAKKEVAVHIVAESAEIKNDRWRNAIEGYLHTQKYYLIVPQEYFRNALQVFNAIKREKKIYGTGIVDIEKLRKLNPKAESGSLVEEIKTEEADVQLFINFALGRVQKCEDVQELRQFRTSITDEGMLYQNFVVRAMNPERWAKPAIGQGAIQRRLDAVIKEIAVLTEQVAVCASVKTGLAAAGVLLPLSDTEIEALIASAENMAAVPALENDLASLRKNRAAVDESEIEILKSRIAVLDNDIDRAAADLRRNDNDKGRLEEKLRRLQVETIPQLTAEQRELESLIASNYSDQWIETTGFPRYDRELAARGKAEQIAAAFPREQSRVKKAKEAAWESLLDLRHNYNDKYKMGYDVRAPENEIYDAARLELTENQLPEYQARITDAKSKAFEQFQEDFISRLQNNVKNAKRQIDELNSALKDASFGEDTYRFKIAPNPEKKRYYDMIMDEMITQGGYNLLSIQFNEKYKEEISDLFANITNDTGGGSSEYERRVREYTDFRSYLSFDLEVLGKDGESQRLSKTLGKKSGGETQTPFYIAVLASFAQLYRTGKDKTYKTSRLIIFDEAFSKMDGERIVRSIELLRKFGFQAILSAPPDKIGDIATLVDRIIGVQREGKRALVWSADPKQMEEYGDAQRHPG